MPNISHLNLDPAIEKEYRRVHKLIPSANENLGENCLTGNDVLKAHFLIANHFLAEGKGLGGIGPRSNDLFVSAIFRQATTYGGNTKWTNKYDICATLFYGLIANHAFHDANKRTAFLSALLHLKSLDLIPSVPAQQFEDFTVEIADRKLGRYKRYQKFRNDGDEDAEVRFISHYLRNNTRQIDNEKRFVTFNDLRVILKRHGFLLGDPNHNRIDVIKVSHVTSIFGRKKERQDKITQVGFPRWSAQVSQSDIKNIRERARLTSKDGVDSKAFFEGLEPINELIGFYNDPLSRLADR